ncbi:DUF721 domain-containing protein [Muribaculum caecicola]|jgi:hypothetical protein|uniref:DUF721 domain-containing protein n=3 Tax=Muribaculum TaxID=1918540 RepID=A0AC61S7Y6_9BACT|nr:DUF721 domain-containing protein [Muribaculum caecicola]THG54963.1 DUF721 domain-containing protein [Muribaculum caecicola]
MRPTEPKLINEIIQQYMRADGIAGKASRQQASYLWTEIVGPGINRYTTRRYVTDDGIMHVYLSSAVLKQELTFQRSHLVDAINRAVGQQAITDIVFH